jgi:hypothetical protein
MIFFNTIKWKKKSKSGDSKGMIRECVKTVIYGRVMWLLFEIFLILIWTLFKKIIAVPIQWVSAFFGFGFDFVRNSNIFFYGFFILKFHTYPITQSIPLLWIRLDGFVRIDSVCITHVVRHDIPQWF